MKKIYYAFSFDKNEGFADKYDSIDKCIEEAKQTYGYQHFGEEYVYIGEYVQFNAKIDVQGALGEISQCAYDDCGEIAEEYLYDVEEEQLKELDIEINKIFKRWLEKYNYNPNFGNVINVKRYKLSDEN